MNLELQFKLKQNPLYIKYLRENSYWYKILIRDPKMFDKFIENEIFSHNNTVSFINGH